MTNASILKEHSTLKAECLTFLIRKEVTQGGIVIGHNITEPNSHASYMRRKGGRDQSLLDNTATQ
jgi:hypothetical protein